MSDRLLMTPGPTAVPRRVREAMSRPMPNPDVEPAFAERYREVTRKLAAVYDTDHDVVVPAGEGILGLEASVASLIEPGDEVLCITNGVYGDGFADFVELYGGVPIACRAAYDEPLDVSQVESALRDRDPVVATVVHCETPTGTLNELDAVLDRLASAGVLTVVDAVSSLAGAPVPTDDIDVCVGAPQKCLSAPPGLTTLAVSDAAWERVEAVEPRSFYASLEPWRAVAEGSDEFPYTHLPANVAALDVALDAVLDEGIDAVYERHASVAAHCRRRAADLGLSVFPDDEGRSSPTVTALRAEGRAAALQRRLREDHDVVVATSLGDLAADVLRIGHMGYNADRDKVDRTMDALADALAADG